MGIVGGVIEILLLLRLEALDVCGLPPPFDGELLNKSESLSLTPMAAFPLSFATPVNRMDAVRAEDATVFDTLTLAVDTVLTRESKFFLAVSLKLSKFFFVDSPNVPRFFFAVSPKIDMALNNPKSGNSGSSDRSETFGASCCDGSLEEAGALI